MLCSVSGRWQPRSINSETRLRIERIIKRPEIWPSDNSVDDAVNSVSLLTQQVDDFGLGVSDSNRRLEKSLFQSCQPSLKFCYVKPCNINAMYVNWLQVICWIYRLIDLSIYLFIYKLAQNKPDYLLMFLQFCISATKHKNDNVQNQEY